MKMLSEVMREHLDADRVQFYTFGCGQSSASDQAIVAAFATPTCFMWVHIRANDEDRTIRMVASSGLRVPSEKLAKANDYISQANHRLKFGHFNIDPQDGELQYVISAPFDGMAPTLAVFRRMVGCTVKVFGEYFPSLVLMVYTDATVSEALSVSEGPSLEVIDEAVAQLMGNGNTAGANAHPSLHTDSIIGELPLVKRGRGRPRKAPLLIGELPAVKRGRGRPRKTPLPQ